MLKETRSFTCWKYIREAAIKKDKSEGEIILMQGYKNRLDIKIIAFLSIFSVCESEARDIGWFILQNIAIMMAEIPYA